MDLSAFMDWDGRPVDWGVFRAGGMPRDFDGDPSGAVDRFLTAASIRGAVDRAVGKVDVLRIGMPDSKNLGTAATLRAMERDEL